MKAELEKELSSLSLEEKHEVLCYLMPLVAPEAGEGGISIGLTDDLDARVREDELQPDAAISLDEFKLRWAHRK